VDGLEGQANYGEDRYQVEKHNIKANKTFNTARMKTRNNALAKNLSYFQKTAQNIKGSTEPAGKTRNDFIANQKLVERRRMEKSLGHLTQYWNFVDVRPPNHE